MPPSRTNQKQAPTLAQARLCATQWCGCVMILGYTRVAASWAGTRSCASGTHGRGTEMELQGFLSSRRLWRKQPNNDDRAGGLC